MEYLIFLVVVAAITFLAWFFIKKYFDYLIARAKSPTRLFIRSVLVIFAAFSLLFSFRDLLLGSILKLFNDTFGQEFDPPPIEYQFGAFIVLCLAILCIHYFHFQHTIKELEYAAREKSIAEKIREERLSQVQPIPLPEESKIFHQRIIELLQFKYPSARFEYDRPKSVVHGHSWDRLAQKRSLILVSCISMEDLRVNSLNEIIDQRNAVLDDLQNELSKNEKIDDFVRILVSEQSGVSDGKRNCITEDQLFDTIIDFREYLNRTISDFENKKIPHPGIESQVTLSQTFIIPTYNNGKDKLIEDFDQWLKEDSFRQFVILGDYGMGKTSLMRFLAHHQAKKILDGNTEEKLPVLISLTNTSPMHEGMRTKYESFVSRELGVPIALFEKMMAKGKVLFLLDGFDEMGFIGTFEQRYKQLNTLWQLGFNGNKIVLAGRSSFFSTEEELRSALNCISGNQILYDRHRPYAQLLYLDPFNDEQKRQSILKIYSDQSEFQKYYRLINENENLREFSARPYMMHIIREMLPKLYGKSQEGKLEELTEALLVKEYIEIWISRQVDKGIVSTIENTNQKIQRFYDFYSELAGDLYDPQFGNATFTKDDIIAFANNKLDSYQISDNHDREGFIHEILAGYFFERDGEKFRFVYKSFFELFVASRISGLLSEANLAHPLIKEKDWTDQIIKFTLELSRQLISRANAKQSYPSLYALGSSSNLTAVIYEKAFSLFFRLVHYLHFPFLTLIVSIFILVAFSYTHQWKAEILTIFIWLILSHFVPMLSRKKKAKGKDSQNGWLEFRAHGLVNLVGSTNWLLMATFSYVMGWIIRIDMSGDPIGEIVNQYYIWIIFLMFPISAGIGNMIVKLIEKSSNLNFLAKAYQVDYYLFEGRNIKNHIAFYINSLFDKKVSRIKGADLNIVFGTDLESLIQNLFYDKISIHNSKFWCKAGGSLMLSDCVVNGIAFHCKYISLNFNGSQIYNCDFYSLRKCYWYRINIWGIDDNSMDDYSIESLARLVHETNAKIGKKVKVPDWLALRLESELEKYQ